MGSGFFQDGGVFGSGSQNVEQGQKRSQERQQKCGQGRAQVEQFAGREDHSDQGGGGEDCREHQGAAVVGKAIYEKEQDEQGEGSQVRLVQEKPGSV